MCLVWFVRSMTHLYIGVIVFFFVLTAVLLQLALGRAPSRFFSRVYD